MARYPKNSSPKLTLEIIEELTTIISAGSYIETAVAYCGISKDTFYRWLREAKKKDADELYLKLSYAIKRAAAESIVHSLIIIDQAAMGIPETYSTNEDGSIKTDSMGYPEVEKYKVLPDWRAAAWRLEKRHPEYWGKNLGGKKQSKDQKEDMKSSVTLHFKVSSDGQLS